MNELSDWIESQLRARGWRPADLARAAGIPDATLSRILNQTRQAGPEVCNGIAQALDTPPETIFRLAGLLPPESPAVAHEREILHLWRLLPDDTRAVVVAMLRGLLGQPAARLAEPRIAYLSPGQQPGDLDQEIAAFIDEFPELADLICEARAQLPDHAVRALIINVRIWSQNKDDRRQFSQFHTRLSDLLAKLANR